MSKELYSSITLGNTTINFSSSVRNLGVIFDEQLSFKKHIQNVSKNLNYHLLNLYHARPHFDKSSFEIAMHALISTRLDYCNSLYSGLPDSSIRPLQLAQNFAARILSNQSKFSHITPILKTLHWLPVRARIEYKILLFTYKALNEKAPGYLSNLISLYQPTRDLRSADSYLLNEPRTLKTSFGDCSFASYSPSVWKDVPKEIKTSSSLLTFKKSLKTYLFKKYFSDSQNTY